jgi:hypothetical protein
MTNLRKDNTVEVVGDGVDLDLDFYLFTNNGHFII